ncbi:hypothetical protein K438DRAFT_1768088 [Mycena galopus ATCC 62051]|nr:hypothetical protein K438DRAFT_1768088 [Mycena galopus ATCC 62051]
MEHREDKRTRKPKHQRLIHKLDSDGNGAKGRERALSAKILRLATTVHERPHLTATLGAVSTASRLRTSIFVIPVFSSVATHTEIGGHNFAATYAAQYKYRSFQVKVSNRLMFKAILGWKLL